MNIAVCLVEHFEKVASVKRGEIIIRGFLTPIALLVKSDFNGAMLAIRGP